MTSPVRLEQAEILRILWEQSETLEREARHLADTSARLTHAVRHLAEDLVLGQPLDPRELLGVSGAAAELARQVAVTDSGIAESLSELPVTLEADPPSEIGVRATESLARRLALRRPPQR